METQGNPLPDRLRVEITEGDLWEVESQPEEFYCPFDAALKRMFPEERIRVGCFCMHVGGKIYYTSEEAQDYIRAYDEEGLGAVEPAVFELTAGEEGV